MSLLLALVGAGSIQPPSPPPVVPGASFGSSVPLYLFRRRPEDIAKPRKPRRRRLIDALIVARAV